MILITGGCGFIGSHACVALAEVGHDLVIVDDFSNSEAGVLTRLEQITGRRIFLYQGDVRNQRLLETVFARHDITAVMHFAGLKAVGESTRQPLKYYSVNVSGTLSLIHAMATVNCRTLVFSSSATVYGETDRMPITEGECCGATNAYGRSKLMVEEILHDLELSDNAWCIARLRYFNPVGAHESGLLGENPKGEPNNLMPYIAQVAMGFRDRLRVFGGDYPTFDGTGVRDYVHVMDLAAGHVAALHYLEREKRGIVVNLGTGRGTSVLEAVRAFELASGRRVPYDIVGRRLGDVAICYADVSRAREMLGWEAKRDINDMCRDAWRWQSMQQGVS